MSKYSEMRAERLSDEIRHEMSEFEFTAWQFANCDIDMSELSESGRAEAHKTDFDAPIVPNWTFCDSCGTITSYGPDGNDLCGRCIAMQHHPCTADPDIPGEPYGDTMFADGTGDMVADPYSANVQDETGNPPEFDPTYTPEEDATYWDTVREMSDPDA